MLATDGDLWVLGLMAAAALVVWPDAAADWAAEKLRTDRPGKLCFSAIIIGASLYAAFLIGAYSCNSAFNFGLVWMPLAGVAAMRLMAWVVIRVTKLDRW